MTGSTRIHLQGAMEMKGFSATTGVKATLVNAAMEPLVGKVARGVPAVF